MQPSLMVFPCDFPIKIIGKSSPEFFLEISAIVRAHFPGTATRDIQSTFSTNGNYLSITATVHARDQRSLDALYTALTQHPAVHMVL